jgi:tRNA-binding EMAP/Myf-like protein
LEKNQITFKEFIELEKKLDIRMGQIVDAKRVPKSYGLELEVSFGKTGETKKAFTNLGKDLEPEDMIGLVAPFILNLEPSEIKGVKSEVMILEIPEPNNSWAIGAKIL